MGFITAGFHVNDKTFEFFLRIALSVGLMLVVAVMLALGGGFCWLIYSGFDWFIKLLFG